MEHVIENPTRRALDAAWLLALAAMVALFACEGAIEDPKKLETVENVEEHPLTFAGKEVHLAGEVDEVYSDRAFSLSGMQWLFDDEVLVVTREPIRINGRMLRDDQEVSVHGKVQAVTVTEIERDLDWDLSTELEVEWKDRAIVIADTIMAVENVAQWSEKDDPQGRLTSVFAFFAAPVVTELDGEQITLRNMEVTRKSDQGLWVDLGDAPDLFVKAAGAGATASIADGDRVRLSGTLQLTSALSTDMEQWQLSKQEKEAITQAPLLLQADSIEKLDRSTAAHPGAGASDETSG